LDVWFDSGSSNLAVLTAKNGLVGPGQDWRPADVYLEGPDQYRGWFHSSLLVATGVRHASPYHSVVTHGWTLDEQGRPMSKSLGNAIEPAEISNKWGADLLRLWVTSVEYQADVKMSERVMTQLSEAYRKIRNTFRFALGNLGDFDPLRSSLHNEQLEEMDRWMLERTAELVKRCREWYAAYEFHRVYHAIHDYCVVDLSAFYYDVLKDRLYTKAPNNPARRSAQNAIHKITSALIRIAAPILVFTAEEIWKYLPKSADEPTSVHITEFPKHSDLLTGLDVGVKGSWSWLSTDARSVVLAALEQKRNSKIISSSLEAKVTFYGEIPEAQSILEKSRNNLRELYIISQAELGSVAPQDAFRLETVKGIAVTVERAGGVKCERCWNYSTHVGENQRYPTICERCSAALAEIEGAAS